MREIRRDMFADIHNIRIRDDAKRALERQLIEAVRNGTLYLTEAMLQPEAEMIGEVLFGLGRDENTKMLASNWPTAEELITATVHLESMEYDPAKPLEPKRCPDRTISYKDGMKQESSFLLTAATMGPAINGSPYKHMVDNVIDLGKSEADVSLRAAWKILKQHGMGVRPAVRADHRKRAWLVREVPPEELAERKAAAPSRRERSAAQ